MRYIQEKTSSEQITTFNRQVWQFMGERRDDDSYIFNLPNNDNANRALRKAAKSAGLNKHLTFHMSRHTFATLSLTSGVDLYTVSKLLGHTDIKNTQIYARVIDKLKEEAVDKLPEL